MTTAALTLDPGATERLRREPAPAATLFDLDALDQRAREKEAEEAERSSRHGGTAFCGRCIRPLTFDEARAAFIPCNCAGDAASSSGLCQGGCGKFVGVAARCVPCATAAVDAWSADRSSRWR